MPSSLFPILTLWYKTSPFSLCSPVHLLFSNSFSLIKANLLQSPPAPGALPFLCPFMADNLQVSMESSWNLTDLWNIEIVSLEKMVALEVDWHDIPWTSLPAMFLLFTKCTGIFQSRVARIVHVTILQANSS